MTVKKSAKQKQYGVRGVTGHVFPYNCREDAEAALVPAHTLGKCVLVVRDIEPGTPNVTEWREACPPLNGDPR
jgi:hypothetical protein